MEDYDLEPRELTSLLNEALVLAAKVGNLAFVRRLLDSGVNPNAVDSERRSALLMAVSAPKHGEFELLVIKALLEAGANPNHAPLGTRPLDALMSRDDPKVEVVEVLLQAGADPKLNPRLFAAAVEVHDVRIVRAFVEAGADVNKPVPMGGPNVKEAPFEVAARKGRADVAKLLLDAGAVIPDAIRGEAYWEGWAAMEGGENPVRRIVNADTMRRNIEQVMAHDKAAVASRPSAGPSIL